MRLLISGTRHAGTAEHCRLVEDAILAAVWASTRVRAPHTLVHGGAAGVDRIAAELARGWGWVVESHPADWTRGKSAGPLRNAQLVAAGADLVLAFPSTGTSRGTWDLVQKAVAAGLRVHIRPLVVEEVRLHA